jgi:hypothetical protein
VELSGIAGNIIVTAAVISGITGIGLFLRRVWRSWQRFRVRLRQLGTRIDAGMDIVEAQLTVNGGGSLLDKVNKIQGNHDEAKRDAAALTETLTTLSATLADLSVRFGEVESRQAAAFRVVARLFVELSPERQAHIRALSKDAGFELEP